MIKSSNLNELEDVVSIIAVVQHFVKEFLERHINFPLNIDFETVGNIQVKLKGKSSVRTSS